MSDTGATGEGYAPAMEPQSVDNSGGEIYALMLNEMVGTKLRPVRGYRGSNEITLALERGVEATRDCLKAWDGEAGYEPPDGICVAGGDDGILQARMLLAQRQQGVMPVQAGNGLGAPEQMQRSGFRAGQRRFDEPLLEPDPEVPATSVSSPVTFFHQPVLRVPPSQYASNE